MITTISELISSLEKIAAKHPNAPISLKVDDLASLIPKVNLEVQSPEQFPSYGFGNIDDPIVIISSYRG